MLIRRLSLFIVVCFAAGTPGLRGDDRAGLDWWSLQPIERPSVPQCDSDWGLNSIDAFVLENLQAAGLEPSPAADRGTLIRRLSFDLIGFPPSPEDVQAFLEDEHPQAYEHLVERLLRSPHYGERWARHWFDVVRFGETHGFEYNQPRNNAWPYKNWVINALNRDLPYDEFVRLQLAGDVLTDRGEGIVATGFLVAGPHNTTLPSSDKMRKTMRQDEMEDLVATIGQTFLGLTANCGRCHDHKFDPITQLDYYRLVASLSGVRHGEREFATPEVDRAKQQLAKVEAVRDALRTRLREIDEPARRALVAERGTPDPANDNAPQPIAAWDFDGDLQDRVGSLHAEGQQGARIEANALSVDGNGYARSQPIDRDIREKTLEAWVQLDRLDQRGGAAISLQTRGGGTFDAIVFGERDPGQWMAGSDGFRRTQSFGGPAEQEAVDRAVHVAISYQSDGTITGYRDGVLYGSRYRKGGPVTFHRGDAEVVFGLRHAPPQAGRMLSGAILAARLYDRALSDEEIAASAASGPDGITTEQVLARLSEPDRLARGRLVERLDEVLEQQDRLAAETRGRKTYACVSGKAVTVKLLERGDVTAPGEVVRPGGIAALGATPWDFEIPADAPDPERRRKLAAWITDANNPLFARVIVNRLWHHHFGQGIVATPNDFGFSGARPSHPRLLDWLACEVTDRGWSLKAMHRLIVTSATYRQSSQPRPDAMAADADNRMLWRVTPRRLEAEAIRDAMLTITGRLDTAVGGPPYRDVRHYEHKGSNFYDPIEQNGGQLSRRTVYRFSPRGAKRTMLDTFDCPDPSATTPRRAVTTTPLQALALLNNPFVLQMAEAFANRLEADTDAPPERQVARAYALAYGRDATPAEVESSATFVRDHGLPAFCRVLFNTNEFLYVR